MTSLYQYVTEKKFQEYLSSDREHYKFLAALSDLFQDQVIVDVGTFKGLSALSLAVNKKNRVVTVNIEKRPNYLDKAIKELPIEMVIQDILDIEENEYLVKIIESFQPSALV